MDRRVLDLGCGSGANARLMARQGREVHAVTASVAEAERVAPFVNRVVVLDIERNPLPYESEFFDAIVASHVLEHLVDPWTVVGRLRGLLRSGGRLCVAVPNVSFYKARAQMLLGNFAYADHGILDRLHLRFFNYITARELVMNANFDVVDAFVLGGVPLRPVRRMLGGVGRRLDVLGSRWFPNLFGFHIIVVGERRSSIGLP